MSLTASFVKRARVWTMVAAFLCVLTAVTPARAYADDGFMGGLQDLVGVREVETGPDYESEYQEGYTPQLRAGGDTEVVELTNQEAIESVVDQSNKAKVFGQTERTLVENIPRWFTLYPSYFLVPAAGLVFFWWGVRKALQVLMSSFRKGSMSL